MALGLVFWVTRRKAVAATSEEEMRTLILGEHLEKSDAVPSTTA